MNTTLEHKSFDSYFEMKIHAGDFPIVWQFPKEFKRNWFKQLDVRFLIILIATFIVEVGTILSFLSWSKGKDNFLDVNSIQKRYAHLLLDRSVENDFFLHDSKQPDTYLYGVPEHIETGESSFNNRENYNVRGNSSIIDKRKSRGLQSTQDNISEQSGSNGTSNSYGTTTAERIGSMGILGYLSEDKVASNADLLEIFMQGDRNTSNLEGSLTNVKFTNFKQSDKTVESGAEGGGAFFRGLKGSKRLVSNNEVQAALAPLEKANYRTVAKNTELEESSLSILAKTGSKAIARKAEHVTRVVLDHNRAIQDCYKQALKKQPHLKGKVVVRFSVTPDGRVDFVEVINSTIDYEPMINCIVNRIRRWNDFGESDISLGTVSYRQTYVFGY
jgi:hypothetical protein